MTDAAVMLDDVPEEARPYMEQELAGIPRHCISVCCQNRKSSAAIVDKETVCTWYCSRGGVKIHVVKD